MNTLNILTPPLTKRSQELSIYIEYEIINCHENYSANTFFSSLNSMLFTPVWNTSVPLQTTLVLPPETDTRNIPSDDSGGRDTVTVGFYYPYLTSTVRTQTIPPHVGRQCRAPIGSVVFGRSLNVLSYDVTVDHKWQQRVNYKPTEYAPGHRCDGCRLLTALSRSTRWTFSRAMLSVTSGFCSTANSHTEAPRKPGSPVGLRASTTCAGSGNWNVTSESKLWGS